MISNKNDALLNREKLKAIIHHLKNVCKKHNKKWPMKNKIEPVIDFKALSVQ